MKLELFKSSGDSIPLYEIAEIIRSDWEEPYFDAIRCIDDLSILDTVYDYFQFSDAKSVIRDFLKSSKGWKGSVANEVKDHLRFLLTK
jgi:hypothetical protein